MTNKKTYIIFLCLIILLNNCFAQTPAEVKAAFPNQEIIFLTYNIELTLMIKNGVVVAESNHNRELMILSEQNAAIYSRSKIFHSTYSELKDMDVYSKIPDGEKYKKIKIGEQKTSSSTSNMVFYDDSKETSFDFPGMVTNAVQHLQYTLFNKDAHLLSPYYLPSSVPVMSATYTVIVPNGISIKYLVKNDSKGQFKFSEEKRKKETVYKWSVNKYKADESFDDAPDDSYYEPHVVVHVTEYEMDNNKISFLKNVDDLFKWNISFTKDLNTKPDASLQKIVDSLILGKKNETEKAASIYKWVQQHIKYIAFEAGLQGFTPRQAADICNKRYGDCKDMSSIITQMLKLANIKGYYTWIGTRHLPYKYTEIPTPIVDNHMISVANINNEWIFLDGTNPHSMYNMPSYSIQDKEALIAISEKEYKILKVPITASNKSGMIDSTFVSFTKDGIKGKEKVDYFGYLGEENYISLLYKNETERKVFVKTKMEKASNKFILGDYKITEVNPSDNNLNITVDFEIPGYGKKIANEYYINLNLEKLFENKVIDTEKRKIPIEEDFKFIMKQYHILQIPDGFTVTYKPQNFNFENELVSLKITYEIKNGTVIAYQEYENKCLLIEPVKFEEWNKAAKAITTQYKEQVVLEKK